MVSTEAGIAIAEICVYIPIFFLTLAVIFRHGFQKQLGWIYLVLFCVVRIAGAGFKIAQSNNPTNKTDIEWASILQSVGLSPLLLASLGLLKRVTDEVSHRVRSGHGKFSNVAASSGLIRLVTNRADANSRRSRTIQIAQLPAMIALILCIVGGLDQADYSNPSDLAEGKTLTKIGIVIFLIIYIVLFAIVIITMADVGNARRAEKLTYFAIAAALPLLAVRLLWSLLAAFANNPDFSLTSSKPLIQLFMAVLEEFFIVCIYTIVGLSISNH